MTEIHSVFGDKVRIYRRETEKSWFCSTYLNGQERRKSTKEVSLRRAKDFAEDWYLELRDKSRRGERHSETTFEQASKRFTEEYEILTEGGRNDRWVQDHYRRIRMHLNPFFGKMPLSQFNAGTVQDYRIVRMKAEEGKKAPSPKAAIVASCH